MRPSILGLGFLTLCIAAAVAMVSFKGSKPVPTVVGTASEPAMPPSPPPPPSIGERLAAARDISAAFAVVRPRCVDGPDFSVGHALFAGWSNDHLAWPDVADRANTTWAKTRKDPATERGKTTCVSGTVQQITVDRGPLGTFFHGTIVSGSGDWWRFTAVRDTGELVQSSYARLCGVVTGVSDYANVSGGQTPAVTIVGMFDLPSNRKR